MATIKQVAQAAGVSTTTVSHVINGTRFVSDDLRRRVVETMAELDYRPSSLARGLRVGTTHTIGLIVPDNSNPFFAEIARVIEDVGYAHGFSLILCNSDGSLAKEATYVDTLIASQIDGIVFISSGDSGQHIRRLTARRLPVVIVDRQITGTPVDTVLLDNERGGRLAVDHLLALGHRRIACITGPSQLTPSAQRVDGYRRALFEASLASPPEYQVTGNFRIEGGRAAMMELMRLPERPTAVFVCNDMMAVGAILAVRDQGLAVPRDVSIIGFDDIVIAQVTSPALTTVAQPTVQIGQTAAQLLLARMRDSDAADPPKHIILEPRLVLRDSCAGLWTR